MKLTSHKQTNIWFHSCKLPTVVKFIETESRMVGAKGWGKGKWEMLSNGYRVLVLPDKEFRDLSYNDVNILNTSELYT